MSSFRKSLITILIVVAAFSSRAQSTNSNEIEFDHISIPGTMSSAMVEDMVQDPLGMLWMGKLMLHRYDGKRFKSFNTIYPDSVIFNGKEITKLVWDKKGNRLLIGTRNLGLLQFRYEDNYVIRLPSQSGIPIISDIAQTEDGRIWISSFANGLFTLENDTLKQKSNVEGILQPLAITTYKDDLWVGGYRSLFLLRHGRIQKSISLQSLMPQWEEGVQISSLFYDRGFLWIGTERSGVI